MSTQYIIYSVDDDFKTWKVCRFNPDWVSNSSFAIPPTLDKSTYNDIRKSSTLVTDVYRHFVYFSTRGNK